MGSYGEMSGAVIAAKTSRPRINSPKKPSGLRYVRTNALASGCADFLIAFSGSASGGLATSSLADRTAMSLAASQPQARVEHRVGRVYQQVDDDKDQHQQQQSALNHRVVAIGDSVQHHASHAG